jgi:ribosome-interacting GTPase 1
MIHEAVMAIKYRLTIDDIIDAVHVFPTMTEAMKLVATSFNIQSYNIPSYSYITKYSCLR